jgi:hypothetical protein
VGDTTEESAFIAIKQREARTFPGDYFAILWFTLPAPLAIGADARHALHAYVSNVLHRCIPASINQNIELELVCSMRGMNHAFSDMAPPVTTSTFNRLARMTEASIREGC